MHATLDAPDIVTKPTSHALRLDDLPVTLAPHRNLLVYYCLASLLAGPFFLFPALPAYFRFRTMRYEIDDEGITMRWGILFRREVSLTYARIQDIQLTSNLVERWLGLARIQLQTASGSSSAEMTLEGLEEVDALRDFLYARMRGVRGAGPAPQVGAGAAAVQSALPAADRGVMQCTAAAASAHTDAAGDDELAELLREIASELRAMRRERERQGDHHG